MKTFAITQKTCVGLINLHVFLWKLKLDLIDYGRSNMRASLPSVCDK